MEGLLGLERRSLPKDVRAEIDAFFQMNIVWLAKQLKRGRDDGVFSFPESSTIRATLIIYLTIDRQPPSLITGSKTDPRSQIISDL